MNKTLSEVKDFFNAINILYKNEPVNVLAGIAPAYPFIYPCIECNNTPIKIFAQNVSIISCTSGVSIEQLKSLNVEYCLI
jgi:triosephosphate isomerase